MYEIQSFNPQTTDMVFKLANGNLYTINLKDSGLTEYGGVNPNCHYFDTKRETIVKINIINRVVTIDNDGTVYRRATQYEFDKWLSNEDHESHNAKVYNILSLQIQNLHAVESDTDSDSDDYYRGNLDNFINRNN